jgi:hypothetical protein
MNLLKMLIHLALQSEAGKVWILYNNIDFGNSIKTKTEQSKWHLNKIGILKHK